MDLFSFCYSWNFVGLLFVFSFFYIIYFIYTVQRPFPGIQLVGAHGGLAAGKRRFIEDSAAVVREAMMQTSGVLQIISDNGPKILLPWKFVHEIRNEAQLSLAEFLGREFLADHPDFGASKAGVQDEVFSEIVRIKLTQSLAKLTLALREEASLTIEKLLPRCEEWKETEPFYSVILHLISSQSARVFLGVPLCRDPEWLKISAEYPGTLFAATHALRKYPPFLRRLVSPFLPQIKQLREEEKIASRIIESELQRRRIERQQSKKEHEDKPVDSLEWIHEIASTKKRPYNVVLGQLALTLVALHTTSAALTNVMFDFTAHPDLIDEMRQEIIEVFGSVDIDDWKRTSLHRLRLMDSAMKESHRLNPPGVLGMRRIALANVVLSDGTVIPRDAPVAVSTNAMQDPEVYDNPDHFDGHRFLRLREQPGHENKWQFVTTSPEMFSFGHGQHACPGRFFAGDEMKIALVYLLMKYDWKFVGDKQGVEATPKRVTRVEQYMPDQTVRLMYRSREPEINL